MFSLLKHEVKTRSLSTLIWGIGLALFGMTYIIIYPQVQEQLIALADWDIYYAIGFEMATFEGFLGSTVVLFIPVILGIYVIINSTQTLAGEEEDGTLELLLAQPLPRWRILTAKVIALGLSLLVIQFIVGFLDGFVLNYIKQSVEVNINYEQLLRAVLSGCPLLLAFAMLGFALSAWLPSRRTASVTLTVLFLVSYFGENLTSHVDSLSAFGPLSLFHYFDTSVIIFSKGARIADVGVLLGLAAVFYVLALWGFQKRNVTTGVWVIKR